VKPYALSIIAGSLLLSSPSWAAPVSAKPTEIPAALKAVEMNYAKSGTLTARFTQIQFSATSGKRTTSYGLILVKHPDKLRWQTIKPDPNLLVSDGKSVWYYTPPFDEGEAGQLIERKAGDIQSHWAQALLSGKISKQKGLKLKFLGKNRYRLIPTKGTSGTVFKAEVDVDPDKQLITKVILFHKGGNQADITLSDIQLGQPIEDAEFQFVKPPNTEMID